MSAPSPGQLLLVEDDAAVRLLLRREFEDRGYDVVAVDAAEHALPVLARQRVDVVLTAVRMPGMGGIALCRAVRRDWPATDVVLMTGFASLETAAEGLRLGAFDYLLKPFGELDLVVSCIDRALEKQRLAAESESLRQRLAHSDRLVTIGRLAAGVAHEINNPAAFVLANLTAMQQAIHELRLLAPPNATLRLNDLDEMIAENQYGLRRIAAIVRDLRNFSRIEPDTIEWVDANQVAHQATTMVLHQIRLKAQLVSELGQVPVVAGDKGKLVQVVVNLLVNACQAIPDGEGLAHRITLRTATRGDRIVLEVEDTGQGIPEADLGGLFEPFTTSKGRDQGSGLGLSLAKEIVAQHGGELTVVSRVSEGSVFTISLPLDTGLSMPQPRPLPAPAPPAQRRRILMVDDEKKLLRACQRMLSKHFDVVTCPSAEEGLAVLEQDRAFEAIVCDLMMGGMDGEQFYGLVHQRYPDLGPRVLIMTGGTPRPRTQEFAARLTHCLQKPFTLDAFRSAVDELLEGVE